MVDNAIGTRSANRITVVCQRKKVAPRMDASLLDLLRQMHFSADLPEDVLEQVASVASLVDYPAGTVIFREGSPPEQLLLIAKGRIALEMHVPGRGNVRILSLCPGELAAWSSLVGSGPMTASGVAIEDTQVLALPAQRLRALCDASPELGYLLMRRVGQALANRLVATRLQLLDLFSDDPAPVPLGTP